MATSFYLFSCFSPVIQKPLHQKRIFKHNIVYMSVIL
jgi:hypothetical protein